jgi:predicted O-methyltransferase YrrM
MIKEAIKGILNSLPYISHLNRELKKYKTWYPPGHYYNPLVDPKSVEPYVDTVFDTSKKSVFGIDFREEAQLKLLDELLPYYKEVPFPVEQTPGFRYYLGNGIFSYSDGIFLYMLMRHFRPNRIIEVGSGHSSAVMIDTNERFLNDSVNLTFIEPYPERLYSLLKDTDKTKNKIFELPIQQVPFSEFEALKAGDFLFVDSSHVSKTGSDVNYIFFEVLPRLKSGVIIHFHDIFTPMEYPKSWVMKKDVWFGFNEIYILRAFLMYNPEFEVIMFNTFLEEHHEEWFKKNMPLCLENKGGSIWLRKK